MNKKMMNTIFLIILILFIISLFFVFSSSMTRENFFFRKRNENSNKCSMKTNSKDCVGYGSDGYCEWCGTNGCHSADEIAKRKIQGCRG